MELSQIRPGILVTESICLRGGIFYNREEEESYFEDKSQIKKWKTTSVIEDVEERAEALRVRARIYKMIRDQCVKTPVGLICEKEKENELQQTLNRIKEEKETFNKEANTCQLVTHYACFEVRSDNYQTLAAILDQVADVAKQVDKAIKDDDFTTLKASARRWLKGMKPEEILLLPEEDRDAVVARARAELIRKALIDIRGVERLLPEEAGKEAKKMVRKSKRIAKDLCKKVEKRNESLQAVLDSIDSSGISNIKHTFVLAAAQIEQKFTPVTSLKAPERKIRLD